MNRKKLGVFIGRFQPLHNGHIKVMSKMMDECDYVLILVGSANSRRTIKNPFTFGERASVIRNALGGVPGKLIIASLDDHLYNDTAWASQVQSKVEHWKDHGAIGADEVVLYGHTKDESSYYLKMFPQWKYIEVESGLVLDATVLRKKWFDESQSFFNSGVGNFIPKVTRHFLDDWEYDSDLQADWAYYKAEAEKFKDYPYPETLTFNCGDAVVECANHILLIKRRFAPGRNAWALPGGFKNRYEKFLDTIFRELIEESNIRVPEKVLRGSLVKTQMFDDSRRSLGIPRATMAGHIKIDPNPDGSFPRVSPADDACEFWWCPISKIVNNEVFLHDDHGEIIKFFVL